MQFANSDWLACEVDIRGYSSIKSAFSSYAYRIKRLNVEAHVAQRGDRLFLVKDAE